ncbi:MAG TPA: CDP-glucose 4,6-dehydratase [Persephonella sp.]|uniref:CDP-glucose 4,6-dehydratase n=1 Tax=Persephonella marina (strain DSM 14350 / EX-H1) TaxID=123214 RepID=C0QSV2_PERMH|nr:MULTISPECIES: CDP-glucose 4,6-dehydratase [Persephonella]ACO04056.1 CDP-glucose 4,6-dehydratase [Persephonella marina EX-H1]HCB70613.1 CDP-glucose 4,6-dehydratase [Persephonella sp.]
MKNLFNNIYEGKRVLITGHTGFKGSWITLWLKHLGAEVIGYSLEPPTEPSLFETLQLDREIIHIIGDIRDENKLKEVFNKYQPDIVIHMAAQPLVRYSYINPKETYETNVIGTLNVFEAVKETDSVRVVINVTSDKCYENKEWVYGYRENDPMGGYDPYSSSKGCAELLTSAYRKSFFNPKDYGKTHHVALASVRAGNVIGGGDWAEDRLIPDCIRSLSKGETIHIRNPKATRPWQHVLEPLSGYLWLGALMWEEPVKYSEGWNFGPNDEDILTVEEIVKDVIKIWGDGDYTVNPDNKFHEARLLKLDISKAHSYLKWKPVYNARKALLETINWYKIYLSKSENIYDYTVKQLSEYVEKAQEKELIWTK